MVAYNFKKRFVTSIRIGLGDASLIGKPKRQTIRGNRWRHANPGEILQLYCGQRTKYCFKIGEARCTDLSGILLQFSGTNYVESHALGVLERPEHLDLFAKNDGFEDWLELREFWRKEHPGIELFQGTLIRWKPLSSS